MLFLPPSLPQSIQGKRKTREVIQVPSATNKGVLSFPLNRALAFNHRIHFQNEGPAFTANWSTITLLPALWLLFSSWIYKMSWVKTAAFRLDNGSSCKSLLVTWQKKACIWWTATNGNSTHWKADPAGTNSWSSTHSLGTIQDTQKSQWFPWEATETNSTGGSGWNTKSLPLPLYQNWTTEFYFRNHFSPN